MPQECASNLALAKAKSLCYLPNTTPEVPQRCNDLIEQNGSLEAGA